MSTRTMVVISETVAKEGDLRLQKRNQFSVTHKLIFNSILLCIRYSLPFPNDTKLTDVFYHEMHLFYSYTQSCLFTLASLFNQGKCSCCKMLAVWFRFCRLLKMLHNSLDCYFLPALPLVYYRIC